MLKIALNTFWWVAENIWKLILSDPPNIWKIPYVFCIYFLKASLSVKRLSYVCYNLIQSTYPPHLPSWRIFYLSSIILQEDLSFILMFLILIISFIFNYSHSRYIIYSSWGYLYLYVILVLSSDKCNWWTFPFSFIMSYNLESKA